uniref:Retrotransposon gag domain-containing protein n=1 Tax=Fagus sylvatica TaxID=28930 RepID=A0A2N9FAV6_FAGSY
MKEMKSQVKTKAAKNLDMLIHCTESPFTKKVDEYPLPAKFKFPQLETFDGFKDPLDYLDSFRTIMRFQGVLDEIMCRAFPTNLRGSARTWFNQLETGSIDTFAQLSRAFIDNFIGGQRSARLANYLLNIQQREGESLRSYVQRFNKEAVQIDEPNEYVALTAFNAGLRKGDFLFQLCKDPPNSMSEFMYKAQKFINAEDAFEARDEFPSKKRKELEDRRYESSKSRSSKQDYPKGDRKNVGSSSRREERSKGFTPLNMSIDQFVRRDNQEVRPEPRPPRQEENRDRTEDRPRDIIGEIRTIVGGLASEGTSWSSRKAYARQVHNILVTQRPQKNVKMDDQVISFSEDDARGIHQLHDDALVVTMTIAGFITRRVLIDNGSSVDIIYLSAYQQMKIDKERLRPIDIPLVGFTGDKVRPSGVVSLIIEAGTYPKQVRTFSGVPRSRLSLGLQRNHRSSNPQQAQSSDFNLPPPRPIPQGTRYRRTQRRPGNSKRMVFRLPLIGCKTPDDED